MKITAEYTDISDQHIQVVSILRLNQQERRELVKHFEIFGGNGNEDGYVILPFYGMQSTGLAEFLETGEIVIDQWTDKDRHYTTDEQEISMLESMLADDLAAIKRLAKVESRPKRTRFDWSKGKRI